MRASIHSMAYPQRKPRALGESARLLGAGYDRNQERASWHDGEAGRLESAIQEIAVEVVTSAEISCREGCARGFDWRVRRRAQLEEDVRNRQQEVERKERDRRQKLEQARIDRLLDEAASLRRAMDIRTTVAATVVFFELLAGRTSGGGFTELKA